MPLANSLGTIAAAPALPTRAPTSLTATDKKSNGCSTRKLWRPCGATLIVILATAAIFFTGMFTESETNLFSQPVDASRRCHDRLAKTPWVAVDSPTERYAFLLNEGEPITHNAKVTEGDECHAEWSRSYIPHASNKARRLEEQKQYGQLHCKQKCASYYKGGQWSSSGCYFPFGTFPEGFDCGENLGGKSTSSGGCQVSAQKFC